MSFPNGPNNTVMPDSVFMYNLYSLIKIYVLGDVVFARFFGTPVVILNSQEAVDDLLVKRSANYSDRPPFVALKDLCVYIAYVIE